MEKAEWGGGGGKWLERRDKGTCVYSHLRVPVHTHHSMHRHLWCGHGESHWSRSLQEKQMTSYNQTAKTYFNLISNSIQYMSHINTATWRMDQNKLGWASLEPLAYDDENKARWSKGTRCIPTERSIPTTEIWLCLALLCGVFKLITPE